MILWSKIDIFRQVMRRTKRQEKLSSLYLLSRQDLPTTSPKTIPNFPIGKPLKNKTLKYQDEQQLLLQVGCICFEFLRASLRVKEIAKMWFNGSELTDHDIRNGLILLHISRTLKY